MKPGTRQSAFVKENPYLVHCYTRHDGLSGVVVSDKEYPVQTAFSLINKTLLDFEKINYNWDTIKEDRISEPESMIDDLVLFQSPANTIVKIQKDLEDITSIMHKNIEDTLNRGESLESLMNKSEDLSANSIRFYKLAKKQNRCCKTY